MTRVALVAPADSLRPMLVRVAAAGVVDIDVVPPEDAAAEPRGAAGRLLRQAGVGAASGAPPRLSALPPDLDELLRSERLDLIAGEAELEEHLAGAIRSGHVAALAGWMPEEARADLAAGLAEVGAAVLPLPRPGGVEAPTLLGGGELRRSLTPLVSTYGTVPYRDIDPTPLAWLAYVLMFGMMFGDAGHGALLLLAAAALFAGRARRLRRFHRAWPFVAGAGVTSTIFGLLYGEFFGPTHVVPVLWLAPLEEPMRLLGAALAVGAVLLVGAYAIGTLNRRREGGWRMALYDPTGVAGAAAFIGLIAAGGGLYLGMPALIIGGGALGATGLVLALVGFLAAAGRGVTAVVEATVELFDLVVRLGANLVSFTRLAAFGMTHAALGAIVWTGTVALWGMGVLGAVSACALFVLGNALAFSLEALVAGIQALRLEYYELFSRLFQSQGRVFRPWHVPTVANDADHADHAGDADVVKGANDAKEQEPCPQS
ncbi:MAG TPA: V-type ATPase 116kDa subunit family protein [Streptosporangiaceae bacterium]|nr:V-type ATPase 116kDa subunit family protein [Streptosporangiaceae bacterium]